jgi:hypothetical protein
MTDNVIFMKYGVHAGHGVDKILARKKSDLARFGWFLWGYGGTLCHPTTQVQPFAREAAVSTAGLYLAMSFTPSALYNDDWQAQEYSVNDREWQPLPDGMEVYGSRKAIVCTDLVECSLPLCLDEYEIAVGPSKGTRLSEYIGNRIDKGCARRIKDGASVTGQSSSVVIKILCKVAPPYAVFLR